MILSNIKVHLMLLQSKTSTNKLLNHLGEMGQFTLQIAVPHVHCHNLSLKIVRFLVIIVPFSN